MPRRRDPSSPVVRPASVRRLVERALREDRIHRDRTTRSLFDRAIPAEGCVVAQGTGVLSGVFVARQIARSAGLTVVRADRDGIRVTPGRIVLVLRGDGRKILSVERTLLNFVTHLSGVATATAEAVRAARGSGRSLAVYATRKTTPGLRDVERLAVVHGGGLPHRRDLASAILIKNNHLALLPLAEAVRRARVRSAPDAVVEVEVRTAREALVAARAGARELLIDNASPRKAREILRALTAHRLRDGLFVELSGGITRANLPRYRSTGADAVSLGALTHSAPALPFHLSLFRTGRRSA